MLGESNNFSKKDKESYLQTIERDADRLERILDDKNNNIKVWRACLTHSKVLYVRVYSNSAQKIKTIQRQFEKMHLIFKKRYDYNPESKEGYSYQISNTDGPGLEILSAYCRRIEKRQK